MQSLFKSRTTRVMVDTSVLLSGIVWPRWPYEVLQHALRGDFQLVLSQRVIKEARRIFSEKFPAYAQDFEDFLAKCIYEEARRQEGKGVKFSLPAILPFCHLASPWSDFEED